MDGGDDNGRAGVLGRRLLFLDDVVASSESSGTTKSSVSMRRSMSARAYEILFQID